MIQWDCRKRENQICYEQNRTEQNRCEIEKFFAFTLAEVLITLGIIGVVAAITIPIIKNIAEENIYKNGLKKTNNILSTALMQMVADNGGQIWDSSGTQVQNTDNMRDAFKTYLNYNKIGTLVSEFPTTTKYYKSSSVWSSAIGYTFAFTLIDGQVIGSQSEVNCSATVASYGSPGTQGNICAAVYVDINGKKLPNEFGKDTFTFFIVNNANGSYKLLPLGMSTDGYTCQINKNSPVTGAHGCTYPMLFDMQMP